MRKGVTARVRLAKMCRQERTNGAGMALDGVIKAVAHVARVNRLA